MLMNGRYQAGTTATGPAGETYEIITTLAPLSRFLGYQFVQVKQTVTGVSGTTVNWLYYHESVGLVQTILNSPSGTGSDGFYLASFPRDIKGTLLAPSTLKVQAGNTLTITRGYDILTLPANSNFNIIYHLSTDRIWSNDDIALGQYEVINQAADMSMGSHVATFNLTVPLSTKTGTYYLLAWLDKGGAVTESSESNNIMCSAAFQVVGPPNDLFANRTTIIGVVTSVSGTNVNATGESSEPFHAGYIGGKSVWWTWTAAYTGGVQIDTIGSNFDTMLGVYVGTQLSSLSYVASNNDISATVKTSSVSFSAVRGRTYQIAVDGRSGATGNIKLNIKLTAGILDNSQAVLTNSTLWKPINGSYQGKQLYSAAGSGANTATWTFSNLLSGTYRISTTWLALASAASNAPFSIYDGTKLLGTVAVNQKSSPSGNSYAGSTWQSLGNFAITRGTLVIKLANSANGYVLADGVRFEKVG
jgi:hypothetical protein